MIHFKALNFSGRIYFSSVLFAIMYGLCLPCVFSQNPKTRTIASIDTFIINYKDDTAFYNSVRQARTKSIYGTPTSTHIRFEIFNMKNGYETFFVNPGNGKVDDWHFRKGSKDFQKAPPYVLHNLPEGNGKLGFYYSRILWLDSNNINKRSWKEGRSLNHFTAALTNQVNTYVIDSVLFLDLVTSVKARASIRQKGKPNIPPYVSIGYLPLQDLFKIRKLQYKHLKVLSSDMCDTTSIDLWASVIHADTAHKSLWFSSPSSRYVLRFHLPTEKTQCFTLPEPVPPGLESLSLYSAPNRRNGLTRFLKFSKEDSVTQMDIYPGDIFALPGSEKIMLSYHGNFNENQGDSSLLSSLHKNSLIPGNHWTEMNPSSAIFQVFQMCSIEGDLSLDWQVMVPLEHHIRLFSATESSITGITSVPKDGYYVPALITWHLK